MLGATNLIESWLQDCSHVNCTKAHSYEEAKESVDTINFDVAILDVSLNDGKTGVDLAHYINNKCSGTRVILITAYGLNSTTANVQEIFHKPLEFEKFIKAVIDG